MLNSLRGKLKPLIELAAKPFMWINPNVLSLGSFVVALPGFYFFTKGNTLLGSLFILGAFFDVIDGTVARKTGKTTKFGGVLDATLDRVFDGLVLFCIGVGQIVSWELLSLVYIATVTISYLKAKSEAVAGEVNVGTNKFSIGLAQRGERMALIFITSIANYIFTREGNEIMAGGMVILLIASIFTVIQRAWNIRKI
jgi:archaetidylinositol phosphate synthase